MPASIDLLMMNPSVGLAFRGILVPHVRAACQCGRRARGRGSRRACGGRAGLRTEDHALERQGRHAALAIVGTPSRRPAGTPGGDPSTLERLRVPIIVVRARSVSAKLTDARSIVCGVRDRADVHLAAAAGALADALDLQLVLVHVCDLAQPATVGSVFMPGTALAGTTPADRATARERLGTVAHQIALAS